MGNNKIIPVAVAVVILAAAGGLYFYLSRPLPQAVVLQTAPQTEQIQVAGANSETLAEVRKLYRDADMGFTIYFPQGWLQNIKDASTVQFFGDEGSNALYATVEVNASTGSYDQLIADYGKIVAKNTDAKLHTAEKFVFPSEGFEVLGSDSVRSDYEIRGEKFSQLDVFVAVKDVKDVYRISYFAPAEFFESYRQTFSEMLKTWKPELTLSAEKKETDDARKAVNDVLLQGGLTELGLRYADAKVATNDLLTNSKGLSREDLLKKTDEILKKWEAAQAAGKRFSEVLDIIEMGRNITYLAPGNLIAGDNSNFGFIRRAHALDPDFQAYWHEKRKQEKLEVEEKDKKKAEILEKIDAADAANRLQTAAKIFNTDIQSANSILQGMRAEVAEKAMTDAERENILSKTSQTIATGSNVVLFIAGLSTGASELALLGETGSLLNLTNVVATSVAGANLAFDVGETYLSLGVGNEKASATIAAAKDWGVLKAASYLFSIKDLGKSLSSFNDTYQKLKAAGGGKITPEALKNLWKDKQAMEKIKEDASGNISTMYDWYGKLTEEGQMQIDPDSGKITVISGVGNSKITLNGDPSQFQIKAVGDLFKVIQAADQSGATVPVEGEVPADVSAAGGEVLLEGAAGQGGLSVGSQQIFPVVVPVQPEPAIIPSIVPVQPANPEVPVSSTDNYDGFYTGGGEAASGMSSASLTISGENVSGHATYNEKIGSRTFHMSLTLNGSMTNMAEGRLSGHISGSGKVPEFGTTITASGKFSGVVYNNSIKVSYSVTSSAGVTASESVTLYK